MFENRRCFVGFVYYYRTDEIVSRLHELPNKLMINRNKPSRSITSLFLKNNTPFDTNQALTYELPAPPYSPQDVRHDLFRMERKTDEEIPVLGCYTM